MTKIGSLVAVGRTSDVYSYGSDSVVKLQRPDVPPSWAAMEADYTAAVHRLGVPAPVVRDLVQVEGRDAIVFERIDGRSMWEHMLDAPDDVEALAIELAEVHKEILVVGLPDGVRSLVDRMSEKIGRAPHLPASDREEARRLLRGLPSGAALLHGDLHPGNVLISARGPVVIDWFDVSIGHPVADVVRSSILIRPSAGAIEHLPGADAPILARIHDAYIAAMADIVAQPDELVRSWEAVVAASRLAERAQSDESSLVALWEGREGGVESPLIGALSRPTAVGDERPE